MRNYSFLILLFSWCGILFGSPESEVNVKTVEILGANAITVRKIQSVMRIKSPGLFSVTKFDRRLLKLDAINVKTLYMTKGFLEVTVKDSFQITNNEANIYLVISEGKQYTLKSVEVKGNHTLSDKTINKLLEFRVNKPYDPVTANMNIPQVEAEYHEHGKLFSSLQISDMIGDSVTVSINVVEGRDVYIDTFFIEGLRNLSTHIVTREIFFRHGDLYQKSKIDLTQRRLLETGVFSYVGISPLIITGSDSTVNLLIELRQFDPRQWLSEGGYYPIEYHEGAEPIPGAGVEIEWRNRSLAQTTTNFSTSLILNGLPAEDYVYPKVGFSMGFANQWFLQRRIPTQIGLFYETYKNYGQKEEPNILRYGLRFSSLKKFNTRSYIESGLRWEKFIEPEEQRKDVERRTLKIKVYLDESDSPLFPTNGYKLMAEVNQTGGILGGGRDFLKLDFEVVKYIPVVKDVVLGGRVKYGLIFGWDSTYTDLQRDLFYLGGSSSLRAWEMLKFDTEIDGTPLGHTIRLITNWEIRFPLFWLFGGEVFIDGGLLTDYTKEITVSNMSWDGGFGLTLLTPLIPFRLDFAIPLEKTIRFNEPGSWKIQLGANFIF